MTGYRNFEDILISIRGDISDSVTMRGHLSQSIHYHILGIAQLPPIFLAFQNRYFPWMNYRSSEGHDGDVALLSFHEIALPLILVVKLKLTRGGVL
jgi:hypothetical protein